MRAPQQYENPQGRSSPPPHKECRIADRPCCSRRAAADASMMAFADRRDDPLQHRFRNPFQADGLRREKARAVGARCAPAARPSRNQPAAMPRERGAGVLHPRGRQRVAAIPRQAAPQAVGVRLPPQPDAAAKNQSRQRDLHRAQRAAAARAVPRRPTPDARLATARATAPARIEWAPARSPRTRRPAPASARASTSRIRARASAACVRGAPRKIIAPAFTKLASASAPAIASMIAAGMAAHADAPLPVAASNSPR